MICAECGQRTEEAPCSSCGRAPDLAGRFRLEAELGRGASGTTFRALDAASGDHVAVKEMPLGRASSAKARELLAREARVLSQLSHPGIPRFVDSLIVGQGRGQAVVLVQELIEGRDLGAELAARRFALGEVLAILDELLGILAYLHGLAPPVVHRDLKPGNVMRRPDGSLVLLDFGAVRDSIRDLELGGSTVAGTFGYMAPEQLVGDASPISDLYALGALAVHLASRVDPQQMLSPRGGLDWEGRVDVPEGVRALLRDLLEPDPDVRRRRLGSTEAVRARVRRLRAAPRGAPVVVRSTPRGPAWASALMLGLVGLGGLVGVLAQRAPAPEPVPVAAPPPADVVDVGLGDLPPLGAPDAPVHIVAFSDYQCPFCSRAMDTMAELVAAWEGQVVVHLRDFPLAFHVDARPAHHAVRCADEQGLAHELHWRLYGHQQQLKANELLEHASVVGLDVGAFEACMASGRHEAAIQRDLAAGQEVGVKGTPTFFVNGERLVGAQPRSKFDEAIERALTRRK